MNSKPLISLILALGLSGAPLLAAAQTWKDYTYPQAGFSVQFPAEPQVSASVYRTSTGAQAPSTVYTAHTDGADFTVTVADFRGSPQGDQAAMADAIKLIGQQGQISVDTFERIDRNFGHDITLAGKDGARSAIAIFYVDNRLYVLAGKASPPDANSHTAQISRFQQTLSFVDASGRAPTRPEDREGGGPGRGGPGGPGGRGGPGGPGRGPPPQSAFDDCKGKAAGAAVQHKTPEGTIAATCVQSPQGLFARPNMPPPPPPQG